MLRGSWATAGRDDQTAATRPIYTTAPLRRGYFVWPGGPLDGGAAIGLAITDAPVRVLCLWGRRDRYLGGELAVPSALGGAGVADRRDDISGRDALGALGPAAEVSDALVCVVIILSRYALHSYAGPVNGCGSRRDPHGRWRFCISK